MRKQFVLTVKSDDKPGVVELIAEVLSSNDGSWLESKLAHLANKFVGVIKISIPSERKDQIKAVLNNLSQQGIFIDWEEDTEKTDHKTIERIAIFHALGPDRKGIVKELSGAFASRKINVEELETRLSSMPYSGEALFEASGRLAISNENDLDDLQVHLDHIANELGMDISLTIDQ